MKKVLLAVLAATMTLSVSAIPAKRVQKVLTLSDGTQVSAILVGDENAHWWIDGNGRALTVDSLGIACYINNEALSARKAAGQKRLSQSNARRLGSMLSRRQSGVLSPDFQPMGARQLVGQQREDANRYYTGEKRGLVILVNFSNLSMKSGHNQAAFSNQFNQAGYSLNNCAGSVRDYFLDQSYQQLTIDFDVVGPVNVSKTYSYYGSNDDNDEDRYPATMVIEACKLADAAGVDFSKYDWDDDGEVDQVFLIYAGYSEAAGAPSNTIWPHEWNLTEAKAYGDGTGPLTLDGKKINTYAVSSELCGSSASTMNGVGTACHEFSHCLGFPDFYDSSYAGGAGMMNWDLLCSGSYNGYNRNGECPPGYTSYERAIAGWLDPTELSEPAQITDMPALTSQPTAYVIYNQNDDNEFYLLENRQAEKWDQYTYGKGMLILHVDYDQDAWTNNTVNNDANRQRMTYFPADNSYGTYYSNYGQWYAYPSDMKGDTYPGTQENTSFTDTTKPSAILYSANSDGRKFMGKPITDISMSSDGTISFNFNGYTPVATPQNLTSSNVKNNGFTANWDKVGDAESYNLELLEVDEDTPSENRLLVENFSKLDGASTGYYDISAKLDDYTKQSGWTGSKIYAENGFLKLATTTSKGYITTPAVTCQKEAMTIRFDAYKYISSSGNADVPNIAIVLLDAIGEPLATSDTIKLTSVPTSYILNLIGVPTDSYKVKITTTGGARQRFYLDNVAIYDGNFTSTDLELDPDVFLARSLSSTAKTYKGITDDSYTFTGLTAKRYKFRVQAVSGEGTSAWSAYETVDLSSTGIETMSEEAIPSDTPIYNINGQRVLEANRPGLYIQNGKISVRNR